MRQLVSYCSNLPRAGLDSGFKDFPSLPETRPARGTEVQGGAPIWHDCNEDDMDVGIWL